MRVARNVVSAIEARHLCRRIDHMPNVARAARNVPDHSGGSTVLLPTSGEPSTALACNYSNRTPTGQTRLGPDGARALASVVNRIDLAKPTGGFSCPAASDSTTILAFRLGQRDEIDLWWRDSRCQTLDNGRLGAFKGANPSFYNEFQGVYTRLVPPAATPAN
jgi:hypothetical protein